ncbi:MAG TPA: hypothetical protein VIK86_05630, partial [Candidatus Paceibacterota bacterium]
MDQLRFTLLYNGGTETILVNAPDGWDDTLINRLRSDVYFSVSEKVTTKLPFVKDGMKIIKTLFYNYGIEAVCELRIEQLVNLYQTYIVIFTGNVDFSTFNDNNETVDLICTEGSFWEKIKANEETEYEIDIDSNAYKIIHADFPNFEESFEYTINPASGIAVSNFNSDLLDMTNTVSNTINSTPKDQIQQGLTTPFTGGLGFLTFVNVTDAVSDFHIKGSWVGGVVGEIMYFRISNYDGTYAKTFAVTQLYLGGGTFDLSVSNLLGNFTITELYLSVTASTSNIMSVTITEGYLNITGLSPVASKTIAALRPITVFKSLLQQMNNGTPVLFDNLFLVSIEDYLITCGDAIRGLGGSKIKTTFKEFFNSINDIWGIGFGYENGKAVLREKSYFFKDQLITGADVGEVSNFKLEIYKTHLINSLKVGYEEQTYDDVNGRYEVNQTEQWTLPLTKINKAGDFVSKYRTDVMGITFTSLNLEGKTTTDSSSDNDTFIIHTKTVAG